MSTARNCYEILGVSPRATHREIKEAYIELSKLHHPDRMMYVLLRLSFDGGRYYRSSTPPPPCSPIELELYSLNSFPDADYRRASPEIQSEATRRFSEITSAYGVLSDTVKRQEHDLAQTFHAPAGHRG